MAPEPFISIVDDDDSLRTALVSLIRSLGYATKGFESAEAFLADTDARGCACIVTDIQMAGLSGIQLKERLTQEGDRTPVIMITARLEAGLEAQAVASGAFCFLRKPFDAATLVSCLARAVHDVQSP